MSADPRLDLRPGMDLDPDRDRDPAASPGVPDPGNGLLHRIRHIRWKDVPLSVFVLSAGIVAIALALPVMLVSMAHDLRGETDNTRYGVFTGQVVTVPEDPPPGVDPTFVTIDMTKVDEGSRAVNLTVSGSRVCRSMCDQLTIHFFAMPDRPDRWGMPESIKLDLPASTDTFSQKATLPLFGKPQRFPFDDYHVNLGVALVATNEGVPTSLSQPEIHERGIRIAIEEEVPRFTMSPPTPLNPQELGVENDPWDVAGGVSIYLDRAPYLELLTIILLSLISLTSVMTVVRQKADDLVVSISGVILGMWGIRSVLVQTSFPGVTVIDLVLSLAICLLLLGALVRVTFHYKRAGRG